MAEEELKLEEGEKVNVSRLALIAGLTRREVHRIYKDKKSPPRMGGVSTLAKVVNRWQQDKRFTTKAGVPRVLTYQGEGSELYELASSVSTAINPGTFLFELIRSGTAQKTSRGLKLMRLHDAEGGREEARLDLMADNIETLVQLVFENIDGVEGKKNLHLRTEFDNIAQKKVDQLRSWTLSQGSAFHKKARAEFSKYDMDINPRATDEGGGKAVIVTFSWVSSGE